jgi:hypothetical protein
VVGSTTTAVAPALAATAALPTVDVHGSALISAGSLATIVGIGTPVVGSATIVDAGPLAVTSGAPAVTVSGGALVIAPALGAIANLEGTSGAPPAPQIVDATVEFEPHNATLIFA